MRMDRSNLPPPGERAREPLLEVDAVPAFIAAHVGRAGGRDRVSLTDARGRVLSADIVAPMALPPFDHTAVDGYALTAAHLADPGAPIPVAGRTRAGDRAAAAGGGATRILTGAPVSADIAAVIMQEHVERAGDAIRLTRKVPTGANIRRVGEDVAKGAVVLRAGEVLDVRHVALLSALGIETAEVSRRPKVAIVALGTELVAPGAPRAGHQIYDSNSAMAAAFFQRHGCEVTSTARVLDDPAAIVRAIEALAGTVDLLVTSGGMADGDEDYARQSLLSLGGTWQTLGVRMKPGKPASFGAVGGTTVLGLPGNPFAALVGLVVIGAPMLSALDGRKPLPARLPGEAAFDLDRMPGRAEFFPARRTLSADGRPVIDRLGKGGSARLQPLAEADALGFIASETRAVRRGDRIAYQPLESLF